MLAPDKKRFLLQQACERAHLDWDEMANNARVGVVQFHETDNGAALTSISQSGPWSVCMVLAMGGNEQGLLELSEAIDKFAFSCGCNVIRTEGRQGFELKKQRRNKHYEAAMAGYNPVAIVYEKVIQEPPRHVITEATPGSNDPNPKD